MAVKGVSCLVKLSRLRGRRVVYGGKCIGRVIQAVLSDSLTMLEGIWTDRGLRGVRFISSDHICVIGEDAVTVDFAGERLRMKPQKLFIRAVTTEGSRLGAVTDAVIDAKTLTVEEIIITSGWFDSIFAGTFRTGSYKCSPGSSRVVIPESESEVELW